MHHDFYRHARYYDIAFSYRDVPRETDFLVEAHRRHGTRPLVRALELASGPAYHAFEFAQRGMPCTALDLSPSMTEMVAGRAREQHAAVHAVTGDMAVFKLDQRFDHAFTLLTSISYLRTRAALETHFKCVADHLEAGGTYVVENNHPRDFIRGDHFRPSQWTMERDGCVVNTTWLAEPPQITWTEQSYLAVGRYDVNDRGTRFQLEDRAWLRFILPDELHAAARVAGLEMQAVYGDHDFARSLDDDEAWRCISVYRKPA